MNASRSDEILECCTSLTEQFAPSIVASLLGTITVDAFVVIILAKSTDVCIVAVKCKITLLGMNHVYVIVPRTVVE